jgi:hypothetical protein
MLESKQLSLSENIDRESVVVQSSNGRSSSESETTEEED